MKKLLFYLLIIPLFITSCINNEDVIEPGTANKQNSINIDPFVGVVVKSGDTNADTLDNGILIYAYENGETYSDSPFINGTIFKKGTTV